MQISEIFGQPGFYFSAFIAYALGSIPFAVIVAHFAGIGDIRKMGSGNPGATNVTRLGGRKLGIITLVLDMGKGAVAVAIGRYFGFAAAAALMVVLGHCFPVFLKFKGGKGVATTFGALLVLLPMTGVVFAVFWLLLFLLFKISSLSALVGIWLTSFAAFFCWYGDVFYLVVFLAVLITWRHKSNIKKLIEGSET